MRLRPVSSSMRANAMSVPSGDHVGDASSPPGSLSMSRCPLPSGFMPKMSAPPLPVARENAIVSPRGDQPGVVSSAAGSLERFAGSLPSAFIEKIWYGDGGGGGRKRMKAIWPLSGDHVGNESSAESFV